MNVIPGGAATTAAVTSAGGNDGAPRTHVIHLGGSPQAPPVNTAQYDVETTPEQAAAMEAVSQRLTQYAEQSSAAEEAARGVAAPKPKRYSSQRQGKGGEAQALPTGVQLTSQPAGEFQSAGGHAQQTQAQQPQRTTHSQVPRAEPVVAPQGV